MQTSLYDKCLNTTTVIIGDVMPVIMWMIKMHRTFFCHETGGSSIRSQRVIFFHRGLN